MKKFRHDLVNHIISIKAFIQNNDIEGGIQYLNKINDLIENSASIIDTGNIALDAIISSKKALAESKLIDFNATVQIPQNIAIESTDISIIFGNALDNAIEACERIADAGKRWIKLSVIYDDSSIICKITNSCIKNKNEKLVSLKQDKENHGYGMGNIKNALEKYNHILKISNSDNEFTLTFIIFK